MPRAGLGVPDGCAQDAIRGIPGMDRSRGPRDHSRDVDARPCVVPRAPSRTGACARSPVARCRQAPGPPPSLFFQHALEVVERLVELRLRRSRRHPAHRLQEARRLARDADLDPRRVSFRLDRLDAPPPEGAGDGLEDHPFVRQPLDDVELGLEGPSHELILVDDARADLAAITRRRPRLPAPGKPVGEVVQVRHVIEDLLERSVDQPNTRDVDHRERSLVAWSPALCIGRFITVPLPASTRPHRRTGCRSSARSSPGSPRSGSP